MKVAAIVVAMRFLVVGVVIFVRAVASIVGVVKLGSRLQAEVISLAGVGRTCSPRLSGTPGC